MAKFEWTPNFLSDDVKESVASNPSQQPYALIILNQPFSDALLRRVWHACAWRCCADGGANRLHDVMKSTETGVDERKLYTPDLVKGDLDSLRDDVSQYYAKLDVPIVHDPDQYSTDLMKCIEVVKEKEKAENVSYDIIILGGLSGRLDQTVHTLSLLHKLRKLRERIYVISDDNLAWVLNEGDHIIHIDHRFVGKTCGLLPVGVNSSVISTDGLEWNITDFESSFDGLVSTSNHLLPGRDVWIKTSRPIWWTMELRPLS